MATKRRKAWWQWFRGPRGHRGLPGECACHTRLHALELDVLTLKNLMARKQDREPVINRELP